MKGAQKPKKQKPSQKKENTNRKKKDTFYFNLYKITYS